MVHGDAEGAAVERNVVREAVARREERAFVDSGLSRERAGREQRVGAPTVSMALREQDASRRFVGGQTEREDAPGGTPALEHDPRDRAVGLHRGQPVETARDVVARAAQLAASGS